MISVQLEEILSYVLVRVIYFTASSLSPLLIEALKSRASLLDAA